MAEDFAGFSVLRVADHSALSQIDTPAFTSLLSSDAENHQGEMRNVVARFIAAVTFGHAFRQRVMRMFRSVVRMRTVFIESHRLACIRF